MHSNFKFIENEYNVLYQIGSTAEKYLYSDPNSCLIKLGMFGETVVYCNTPIVLPEFIIPEEDNTDYTLLLNEQNSTIDKLLTQIKELKLSEVPMKERSKKAKAAIGNLNLTEKETRYIIDEQLRKVGWEVDSEVIRYSKGARPEKSKNKAIAEWPTDATSHNYGFADYALFTGDKFVGIIEAKRINDKNAEELLKSIL